MYTGGNLDIPSGPRSPRGSSISPRGPKGANISSSTHNDTRQRAKSQPPMQTDEPVSPRRMLGLPPTPENLPPPVPKRPLSPTVISSPTSTSPPVSPRSKGAPPPIPQRRPVPGSCARAPGQPPSSSWTGHQTTVEPKQHCSGTGSWQGDPSTRQTRIAPISPGSPGCRPQSARPAENSLRATSPRAVPPVPARAERPLILGEDVEEDESVALPGRSPPNSSAGLTGSLRKPVENTEHDIEEWLKEVPVVSLRTNFDTFLQRAKTNSLFRKTAFEVQPTYEGINPFRIANHKRDLWVLEWMDRKKRRCRIRCAGRENAHLYWKVEKGAVRFLNLEECVERPQLTSERGILSSLNPLASSTSDANKCAMQERRKIDLLENHTERAWLFEMTDEARECMFLSSIELVHPEYQNKCKRLLDKDDGLLFELAFHQSRVAVRHVQSGFYLSANKAKQSLECKEGYKGAENLFQICVKIAIMDHTTQRFLSAAATGVGLIRSGSLLPVGFETFYMGLGGDGSVTIKSFHKKLVCVDNDNGKFQLLQQVDATSDSLNAQFQLLHIAGTGGRYIRSVTFPDLYWTLERGTLANYIGLKQVPSSAYLTPDEIFHVCVLPREIEREPLDEVAPEDDPEGAVPSEVFGKPLEEVAQAEGRIIPSVVTSCISYLLKGSRIKEEGIFRISPTKRVMLELRKNVKLELWSSSQAVDDSACLEYVIQTTMANPAEVGAFDVAGLLKTYFRELPQPLCTFGAFEKFCEAACMPDENERVERYKAIIRRDLNKHRRATLSKLMGFLNKVAAEEKFNKMHASNLSLVFAPNILHGLRTMDGLPQVKGDYGSTLTAVTEMISMYDRIFSGMVV